jgi:glutathione S-transferase
MSYDLWYWPGIPGRGEFVRITLEAGGIAYRERGREPDADITSQLKQYQDTQPFAPPWLDTGELVIAQTANILLFLGKRHGLAPLDDKGRFWTNQLQLTIMDMTAEAHDVHHPVSVSAYYEDQKAAAAQAAASFRAERMPKFFTHFSKALSAHGGLFLCGERWCYADLGLYVLVSGLNFAFPRRMAALKADFPLLFDHHVRIAALPELQDYLASDRHLPFGDGIFRHYPELDDAT